MAELLYKDLTGNIINCAYHVHSFLGNWFQEVVYQRTLALEMKEAALVFNRELEMPIFYKHYKEEIGLRRADFQIDSKILVEIKAVSILEDVHLAQILSYIKIYRLEVGLLINFGSKSLTFKQVILT
jgi:GxxExxY protein